MTVNYRAVARIIGVFSCTICLATWGTLLLLYHSRLCATYVASSFRGSVDSIMLRNRFALYAFYILTLLCLVLPLVMLLLHYDRFYLLLHYIVPCYYAHTIDYFHFAHSHWYSETLAWRALKTRCLYVFGSLASWPLTSTTQRKYLGDSLLLGLSWYIYSTR